MRARFAVGLVAGAAVLAGCAAHPQAANQAAAAPTAHSPGMTMADGSTMGAAPARSGGPSPAALMVCGDDIGGHIAEALRLPSAPVGVGTWAKDTYTCRYQLPMGPLVLSVSEAADDAGTTRTFDSMRSTLGATHHLIGLAQDSYGTDAGVVVLRKDHDVLKVDATGLPAVFGPEGSKPADFAYEIASDVLGCWTGG